MSAHTASVAALLFSRDGRSLYSGGWDQLIYRWDVTPLSSVCKTCPAQPLHTLRGHQHNVRTLALAPAGACLASGSADGTVRLWDAESGALCDTLLGHELWVWGLAFHPQARTSRVWLASAGNDGIIRLWAVGDLADGLGASARFVRSLTGHSVVVTQVAFTPDGEWLVSSGGDQTLRIWQRNGETCRVLTGHIHHVGALAVSPCFIEGRLTLASCDQGRQVRIWDFATGETLQAWHEPSGEIYQVTYSPDGKTLAGANRDGYIRLWDVQTGAVVKTLRITKPYTGTNITDVTGITAAQRQVLRALGAVEVRQ